MDKDTALDWSSQKHLDAKGDPVEAEQPKAKADHEDAAPKGKK